jgi:glycosyltransferase involved in cell wall biosynthesis
MVEAHRPISVIVPAKDEAQVIGVCLRSLEAQTYPGPVQVVVVANNCTDRTAAVARRFVGAFRRRCYDLDVLELELPGSKQGTKPAALNAGDAAATFRHRVYLDADIELSAETLSVVAGAFADGVLFCAPRIETAAGPYASRAYARIWSSVPCVSNDVIGAGFYAVHGDGRARWGEFPDIVSDDKFARLQFRPAERMVLDEAWFRIRMPAGFRELVAVRARWIRGNWQLAAAFPELAAGDRRRWREAGRYVARTPSCWRDVPMVAIVYACAEVRALLERRTGTLRWERAERARLLRFSSLAGSAKRHADVLLDEVGVDVDGSSGSFAGSGDDLSAWVGDVAGDPDAGDARESVRRGDCPPIVVDVAAQADEQAVVGDESRWDEEGFAANHAAIGQLDGF